MEPNTIDHSDAVADTTGATATATPGSTRVSLGWTRFADATSGLATTGTYRLVYSTSGYPASRCANGTPILVGTATQFEHQNLSPGTRSYYRVCAFDKAGNVSTGATRSGPLVGAPVARRGRASAWP